jgi:hypothetical protein
MRSVDGDLSEAGAELALLRSALRDGLGALERTTDWILARQDPRDAAAGAMSYLRLWGTVAGGWLMARAALAAKADIAKNEGDPDFLHAKILTARFYGEQILPRASALSSAATAGAATLMAMADSAF